jgi:hypothetical protein
MDPVNKKELKGKHKDRKDKDINNDGKVDGTDKYLHNRRKAIAAAIDESAYDKQKAHHTQGVADATAMMKNAKSNAEMVKAMNKKQHHSKALKKMAGMKEEIEQVNELKKSTLASYIRKASDDRTQNAYDVGRGASPWKSKKGLKRRQGISRAAGKLAKEETQIDEVLDRPGALDSYRKKADASGNKARNSATRKILTAPKDGKRPDHSDELKTMKKRNKGQDMADKVAAKQFRKSIGKGYSVKKEELNVSDGVGSWIKDFKASDAPQFAGKSDKQRREMAVAAYLSAKRGQK